ncbi:MAG: methyltransferase domain-containing protein [Dehalococcoidales bacterium]|nr:methyltransferase domain-containing protein [Dehalococcoidales bacterium]
MQNKKDSFSRKARSRIPFTALNTVGRLIDKEARTVLDVGCGKGEPMMAINRHQHYLTVGIDVFEPYLRECRRQGIHHQYLLGDIRKLPFRDKSFDVVLCMEVLEHLERADGEKLLRDMERTARKQVLLTTPVGKYQQESFEGNPHQEHKYIWSPDEMQALGYKVTGIGWRNLGGKAGIQSPLPRPLRGLVNVIWVLAGPIVYFYPRLAGDMVCTKRFV